MKKYEFSLVFRDVSKVDKNNKIKFQHDDAKIICEQAVMWLAQRLRSKVQYQWELPGDVAVMAGMDKAKTSPSGYVVISNMINGIIVKVRQFDK